LTVLLLSNFRAISTVSTFFLSSAISADSRYDDIVLNFSLFVDLFIYGGDEGLRLVALLIAVNYARP